ncbi:LysR family transcriptional regulator [Mangrovicoccus algicola]|uniref:LysR family transcriptional regulator n=1 Tax=Mangrovicoccus algicola TaxID=2771008 RepID=A0A8J6YVI4_9RHOB|nr:LysR family transcriptional regulator [Mangrovicoccus algicola]MBE3638537.1 LysR family transcriptional regulator [Mangrovicoccus algicola]
MIARNLRHLRLFLAVADLASVTRASDLYNISQPAVTQALGKLESQAGGALFTRTRQGFFLTGRGEALAGRASRAFERLDREMAAISPRLQLTATAAQLSALIATVATENFTLAARRLGLSQPTVHRAVSQLEQEAEAPLFQRSAHGLIATRPCQDLARAAQLAFAELAQAEADLAEFDGREAGGIVIGSLPLARSVLLPQALARFRQRRATLPVRVIDGLYDELLAGLRRGEIDVMIGALRNPAPIGDVVQEPLFEDGLAFVAAPGHPLARRARLRPADLGDRAWVVPRAGTPAREGFERFFGAAGQPLPPSILEAGSILLMRELLLRGDFLGCISAHQAAAEISRGLLDRLDIEENLPGRPIGLTFREGWIPTAAQAEMLDLLRQGVADLDRL